MAMTKKTMTMEELLEQMMKKVTLECEDWHRQFIAALNGLAGIDIIEAKWAEAGEKYREVLRLACNPCLSLLSILQFFGGCCKSSSLG